MADKQDTPRARGGSDDEIEQTTIRVPAYVMRALRARADEEDISLGKWIAYMALLTAQLEEGVVGDTPEKVATWAAQVRERPRRGTVRQMFADWSSEVSR